MWKPVPGNDRLPTNCDNPLKLKSMHCNRSFTLMREQTKDLLLPVLHRSFTITEAIPFPLQTPLQDRIRTQGYPGAMGPHTHQGQECPRQQRDFITMELLVLSRRVMVRVTGTWTSGCVASIVVSSYYRICAWTGFKLP